MARLAAALVLVGGIAGVLRWLPRSVGATWADVAALTRNIQPGWVVLLSVVWLAGLVAHTPVFTASLPGLTTRRALALNLAGSAVGNSVPLGGAVSVGLTSSMIRSWGFSRIGVGAFVVVSAVWNVLVRLVAGVLGLLWLVSTQAGTSWRTGAVMAALSATVLVGAGTVLASDRLCARAGAIVGRAAGAVRRRRSAGGGASLSWPFGLALVRGRRQVTRLVARGWMRLGGGMLAYLLLLAVLLECSLRAIGAGAGVGLVLAAVAIERLVTSIPITPGGAGVAEVGLTACLTLGGVDPAAAVTATLVYRTFTFLLEIPVGLGVAAGWAILRRRLPRAGVRGEPIGVVPR